jgi:carbonic anhydrase
MTPVLLAAPVHPAVLVPGCLPPATLGYALTAQRRRLPILRRLCELNVMRQVFHVCTSPIVQAAWAQGQTLSVFGMIYNLKDGLVNNLVGPISK